MNRAENIAKQEELADALADNLTAFSRTEAPEKCHCPHCADLPDVGRVQPE
jgi:hypothetical protein